MSERLLTLPVTLDELGGITIAHGKAGDGYDARGHYDPATKSIVIDGSCSPVGEAVIVIHEMMHAAECALIEADVFKRHVNRQFIHAASFGCALALAKAGALRGVTAEDVVAFMREAESEVA